MEQTEKNASLGAGALGKEAPFICPVCGTVLSKKGDWCPHYEVVERWVHERFWNGEPKAVHSISDKLVVVPVPNDDYDDTGFDDRWVGSADESVSWGWYDDEEVEWDEDEW